MANNASVVGSAHLDQAAGGNPALRALLQQLTTAANAQATQTNTSSKSAPNQSSAKIAFNNPFYVVTFTDPGGSTALSLAQQQQQATNTSIGANPTLSNIYHQVQAATSILFDAPSLVSTYGGDKGSLQTQFVINDLSPAKSWFFRIRTSYDGTNWNQWRIVSSSATSVNSNAVLLEPINGGHFASVTLAGKQVIGFGVGALPNGGAVQTAAGVLLANSLGIVGPGGSYTDVGMQAVGIAVANINSLGVVALSYSSTSGTLWPGGANFLTFGWVAGGSQNLAEVVEADGGRWIILTLAGGSRIAIGSGTAANSATFDFPAGFIAANSMAVCTPNVVAATTGGAHGIQQCNVVAGLCTCTYNSYTGLTPSTVNWFAFAWETSLNGNVSTVGSGNFLTLPTPSGPVVIGVGSTPSGSIIPLPVGYTYPKCLAFATPGSVSGYTSGQYMHGIELCTIDAGSLTSAGTATCLYSDAVGNSWVGNANWLVVAWQ